MSNLDCNTPVGQTYIAHQLTGERMLMEALGLELVVTDPSSSADIDALYNDGAGVLRVIAEIKARNMAVCNLRQFGSYLITHDKLRKGRELAMALRCRFVLAVYLIADQRLVWFDISDETGQWTTDFSVSHTKTKQTCNGGSIIRENAYLSLEKMHLC